MATAVHSNVKKYYSSLKTGEDLQTTAACHVSSRLLSLSPSTREALGQVHPEVCKRFFGCGVVVPEKLKGCSVLDLGSGCGRDCYILSKLVGEDGHVTGIDMTEDLIQESKKYIQYHQELFGYSRPNTVFIKGYIEKLSEAGIQNNSMDVIVSNCVICLCPDKRAVLNEAFKVLKEGGELYFSDMYTSEVVSDSLKEDPVLWGEGMAGALYWQDFISLVKELGFSTPHLVAASHIQINSPELQKKAGDIKYASGTYRIFKLPQDSIRNKGLVTYKGTVPDCSEYFQFDASYSFKTNVAVDVDSEMAAVLQYTRFSPDFTVWMTDEPDPGLKSAQQYCHLNPFLLADSLGSCVKQCSKMNSGNSGNELKPLYSFLWARRGEERRGKERRGSGVICGSLWRTQVWGKCKQSSVRNGSHCPHFTSPKVLHSGRSPKSYLITLSHLMHCQYPELKSM
ncbi:arsenite methyltransferase [Hoplias malabaricus]|uniref:arsenite methyltransferase n=1 Tax=Hoplias malabaricus TaxID=27720 RepID=UPI0034618802